MAEDLKAENNQPKKMGRPTTLAPEWQAMADKLGGVAKLCGRLSCAERTLRHWSSGSRRPSYPTQRLIENLCFDLDLPTPIFLMPYERPQEFDKKPNTAAVRAEKLAKTRQRIEERRKETVAKYGPLPSE